MFYSFRNGVLRFERQILPLPLLPESPQISQRIAYAVLLHYFSEEFQPERRALLLHRQLARYLTPTLPRPLSETDINALVAQILVDIKQTRHSVSVELISGHRRDTLRRLAAVSLARSH